MFARAVAGVELLRHGRDVPVNWKAVMAALVKVGYNRVISPELGRNPAQADQLRQVPAALDQVLALA